MSESFDDQVSRVEQISVSHGGLSRNERSDLKALIAELRLLREFEKLIREESRPEAIHWIDEQRKWT